MKDADALTLKAFLAALCRQRSPLSEEIRLQLREIAQSLETRIMDLHDLAIATPTLAAPYRDARRWLTSTAAERGMGLKIVPAYEADHDDNRENDNNIRDARSALEKTKQLFAAIEAEYEQASQVLSDPNPVQAAIQRFKQRFKP